LSYLDQTATSLETMEPAPGSLDELQSLCSAGALACPDHPKRPSSDSLDAPSKQRCGGVASFEAYIDRGESSGESVGETTEKKKGEQSVASQEVKPYDLKSALGVFEKQVRSRIVCVEYEKQWAEDCNSFDSLKALRKAASLLPALSPLTLPRKTSHSRLLIFDLDNTLVHCTPNLIGAQHCIQVLLPSGKSISAGIRVRPYASECLRVASQYFEVAVFTASHSCYSNQVIDLLDPQGVRVHHRLFRENCLQIGSKLLVKDLRVIGNFALKDIAIVENSLLSFGLQLYNGVPILTWLGQSQDTELRTLISYLRPLAECEDVRTLNRQVFQAYYSCLSDEDEGSNCDE